MYRVNLSSSIELDFSQLLYSSDTEFKLTQIYEDEEGTPFTIAFSRSHELFLKPDYKDSWVLVSVDTKIAKNGKFTIPMYIT